MCLTTSENGPESATAARHRTPMPTGTVYNCVIGQKKSLRNGCPLDSGERPRHEAQKREGCKRYSCKPPDLWCAVRARGISHISGFEIIFMKQDRVTPVPSRTELPSRIHNLAATAQANEKRLATSRRALSILCFSGPYTYS